MGRREVAVRAQESLDLPAELLPAIREVERGDAYRTARDLARKAGGWMVGGVTLASVVDVEEMIHPTYGKIPAHRVLTYAGTAEVPGYKPGAYE